MTIDSESDLFKAILAMDSYNRGYNAGIVFGTNPEDSEAINGQTQIGVATVYRSDGGTVAQADGFYAIAYQLPDDSVTIAYRGTDQAFDNSETGIGGDFENGYGIASEGKADTPQGMDAFQFFQDVTAQLDPEDPDPLLANISVTGHSSGGGLAGLVGEVYGADGVLFDNMPFNTAATNIYNLSQSDPTSDVVTAIYGDPLIYPETDASGLSGYYLDGDFLEALRGGQNPSPVEMSPGDYVDFNDDPTGFAQGHTMASLIITMYGSDSTYVSETVWKTHAANYLWAGLFDESFAEKAGLTDTSNSTVTNPISGRYIDSNDYANALQSIIAYSVIDDGTRVFGDTAIKAFFHDANALGRVLNTYYQNEQADTQNDAKIPDSDSGGLDHLSSNLMRQIGSATAQNDSPISYHYAASSLTDAIVEYAAALGVAKVLQSQHSTAINGILTFSDTAADTNAHTPANHSLAVNFSDSLWGLTDMPEVTDGSHAPYIAARTEMFNSVMAQTDVIASADKTLIMGDESHAGDMATYWGSNSADLIKQVVYAVDAAGGVVQMPTDVADGITSKVSMFVGARDAGSGEHGNDTIIGTLGNDLVLGSGGTDTYVTALTTGGGAQSGPSVTATEHIGTDNKFDVLLSYTNPSDSHDYTTILDSVETVVANQYHDDNLLDISGGSATDHYVFTEIAGSQLTNPDSNDVLQTRVADINTQLQDQLQVGSDFVKTAWIVSDTAQQLNDTTYINFDHLVIDNTAAQIDMGSITGTTIEAAAGYANIADYSSVADGLGTAITLSADGDLVKAAGSGTGDPQDSFTNIGSYIGTQYADTFTGSHGAGTTVAVNGGGGNDNYVFTLGENTGGIVHIDDTSGLDTITVNTGASDMPWVGISSEGGLIQLEVYNQAETDSIVITMNPTQASDMLENVVIDGTLFRLEDMINSPWAHDEGGIVHRPLNEFYDEVYKTAGTDENGDPNGTGYGGGTTVLTDANGDITGQTVDKSMTDSGGNTNGGGLISYAAGDEIFHPFVVTGLSVSHSGNTESATVYYETATQEVDLLGLTQDDVRFTLSGTEGHAALTVHIDSTNTAFTIDTFEAGKEIHGIFLTDKAYQETVQVSGTSSLVATSSGGFTGTYSSDSTTFQYYSDTYTDGYAVDLTYFFDTLKTSGDGHVFDMQSDTLTFTGTSASESLMGLDNRGDIIEGLAGNDTIHSYGGDDVLIGGTGSDVLYGGLGDDSYVFSVGDSSVSSGGDTISEEAGEGTDTVVLHGVDPGDVHLWTAASSTSLHISYSATDDIAIAGGSFNGTNGATVGSVEQIKFDDGTIWDLTGGLHLTANTAAATVYGTGYGDTIEGGSGNNVLYGYGGDDTLIGHAGNDVLYGGLGDDSYVFSVGDSPLNTGSDTISEEAGEGTDAVVLHGVDPGDVHLWTANNGTSLHIAYSATDDIAIAGGSFNGTNGVAVGSVEQIKFDDGTIWDLTGGLHLVANTAAATVYGTGFGDTIEGGSGNNILWGYGGDDVLVGHAGNDVLYGGLGDDSYVFSVGDSPLNTGSDTISENANEGTDAVVLHGVDPNDVHLWTANNSTSLHISYSATDDIAISDGSYNGTNGVTVGSVEQIKFDDGTTWDLTGGLHLTAHTSTATVYGTAFDDVIEGGSGNNVLWGYGGDDTLIGHAGNDVLYGGLGDDSYVFSAGDSPLNTGSDTISENTNEGTDTVVLHGVDPGDVQLWTAASSTSLHISYSATDDIAISDGSYNGTNGVTVGSVEQIKFDDGTIWDLTGGLHLTAHTSTATVYGTAYNDVIEGGSGNNVLSGYGGDDILIGNGGADTFYGGAGADTFVLTDATHSSTIADFSTTDGDVIDISSLLTGYDPVSDNLSDFVQLTTSGSNTLIKVDTDGAGTGHAMAQIATLSGVTGLNLNDLIDTGRLIVHASA